MSDKLLDDESKSKLALESMEVLLAMYQTNFEGCALNSKFSKIMDNWLRLTRTPMSKADYYQWVTESVAHLQKRKYQFIPPDIT